MAYYYRNRNTNQNIAILYKNEIPKISGYEPPSFKRHNITISQYHNFTMSQYHNITISHALAKKLCSFMPSSRSNASSIARVPGVLFSAFSLDFFARLLPPRSLFNCCKLKGENSRKERLVLVAMMARAEAQKAYEQIKLDSAALEQRYRDSDVRLDLRYCRFFFSC